MTGIYMIQNKINGKLYIGQAQNLKVRIGAHKTELNGNYHHNKHLQNAWNKYGSDNFEFIVIEECDIDNLNEREMFWIDYYGKGKLINLYNTTAGGEGLKNITPEVRQKLSNAKKGRKLSIETKQKMSISRKGKTGYVWTDEQRLKMSALKKGSKNTEKQKETARKLMKERWNTNDWRQKIHNANTSEEHKIKCSGWHHTEEARRKISEAGKRPCKDATKQKISLSLKGRKLSEIHKKRLSKVNANKIWVNNSVVSKMIYLEQLSEYEQKGFKKGRIKWHQN